MAHRPGDVGPIIETRFRVRYAETDQMGIVYYGNYLIWMELGRVEYCRSRGLRYRELEEQDGILLTVAEATCRYLSPARYDDEILVRTWVERGHPRMVQFGYEIRLSEGEGLLATGSTKHLFCSRELKPARLPRKYWIQFQIEQS